MPGTAGLVTLEPGVTVFPFFFLFKSGVRAFPVAPPPLPLLPPTALTVLVLLSVAFPFEALRVGTLGVFTGSIGELVRDREPKNRIGFSGEAVFFALAASNLARPLATAPEKCY